MNISVPSTTDLRQTFRAALWLTVALLAVGAASAPAYGAAVPSPGYPTFDPNTSVEHITSYDVTLKIHRDGGMHVTEMIRYLFVGDEPNPTGYHVIVRTIPNRRHIDAGHDQILGIHNVRVRGADDLKVRTAHDATVLTFGGHDAATSGGGTYIIDYDVAHALTPGNGTDDLYWATIGAPWKVPISAASVTIFAPVSLSPGAFPHVVLYTSPDMDRKCRRGSPGDIYVCPPQFTDNNRTLTFGNSGLAPGENMNLSVKLPKTAWTFLLRRSDRE